MLECETNDGSVKISIFGPLGFYYEDELTSDTAMEFHNQVEVYTDWQSYSFPNSISISNDFNDYLIQSFAFNTSSRQFKISMSLYFESENEERAELKLTLPEFNLETQVYCHFPNSYLQVNFLTK